MPGTIDFNGSSNTLDGDRRLIGTDVFTFFGGGSFTWKHDRRVNFINYGFYPYSMSRKNDLDAKEILSDLDEAERELIEMIVSSEDNTEEIKSEVEDLFDLTKNILMKYSDLASEVEELKNNMESKSERLEQLGQRKQDIMDDLGIERNK